MRGELIISFLLSNICGYIRCWYEEETGYIKEELGGTGATERFFQI